MKQFVSWRRVSTKKQGKSKLGLEAQSEIINYFVKAEGGELIADFCEVYTGKDLKGCTELQNAMQYAKENNAILIIAKTDRFRNTIEALQIYEAMGENNIYFCDLPHTDKFTLTLFFALAEREAKITSIRTKQALAEKKKQGYKLGRKGATFTEDMRAKASQSNHDNADKNENNKRAIAFIKSMLQTTKNYSYIARQLNEGGFTTSNGFQFRAESVKRLTKRI